MKHLHARHLILAVALVPTCAPVATAHMQEGTPPARTGQAPDQPGSDTWITTKVKAALLTSDDVPGMEVHVETRNGTVMLSGHVATRQEADRAIAIASGIEGVTGVDSSALAIDQTPARD